MHYNILFIILFFLLSNCQNQKVEKFDVETAQYPPKIIQWKKQNEGKTNFLRDFFKDKEDSKLSNSKMSINPYLWQASIEVLSSNIPITSIDQVSGVIISDWYNLKGKSDERVKITVLINTLELRADGLKVKIFKQKFKSGIWQSIDINPEVALNLEKKIVQKAGMLSSK